MNSMRELYRFNEIYWQKEKRNFAVHRLFSYLCSHGREEQIMAVRKNVGLNGVNFKRALGVLLEGGFVRYDDQTTTIHINPYEEFGSLDMGEKDVKREDFFLYGEELLGGPGSITEHVRGMIDRCYDLCREQKFNNWKRRLKEAIA